MKKSFIKQLCITLVVIIFSTTSGLNGMNRDGSDLHIIVTGEANPD